jgi:hypothetical protein
MPRRLEAYIMSTGFFELAVAAPSIKRRLRAAEAGARGRYLSLLTVACVQAFDGDRRRFLALAFGPDDGVQLSEKVSPLELVGVVALAVQSAFDVGDGGN